jgi:tRNA-specific 2-thiouridylase
MKVAVGISGGVDSSVAAYLLKKLGYDVVGITMLVGHPGEREMLDRAKQVASRLSIEHEVVDFTEVFEKEVLTYIKNEYSSARTPNPCIRCNEKIKFGVLFNYAIAQLKCDRYATGHYARVDVASDGVKLLRAKDRTKDQSYFLYRVPKDVLAKTLFPLGDMTKQEVRQIAFENGFSSAKEKDSQDFCFGDVGELIDRNERSGNILSADGKILGRHNGISRFTVGMRKGLGLPGGTAPMYVLKINSETSDVIVGEREEAYSFDVALESVCGTVDKSLPLKVRSTGEPVYLQNGLFAVSPGQSAVFYDGEEVVGGGVISK